jgi:hypothetical protein
MIQNYSQQDATFLDLFISTDALHISVGTAFHLIHDSSKQQYRLTIPEAVCTVSAPDDGRKNRLKHVERL